MEETDDVVTLRNKFKLNNRQIFPETKPPSILLDEPCRSVQITKETPIVTMGSCYARFIKDGLVTRGYNYLQTECNPVSEHSSCAWGRVYTTANGVQVLDYILNDPLKEVRYYEHGSLTFDLLRHKTFFKSISGAYSELERHIERAKEALSKMGMFLYVIGQNELWYHKTRKVWCGQCPHKNAFPPEELELHYLTVEENERYLEQICSMVRSVNPEVPIAVCIAPIPSQATFYSDNVVTRSVFYKSVLRVAVGNFLTRNPEIGYFPTYDLSVTNDFYPHAEDHRHPNESFMERTMDVFEKRFLKDELRIHTHPENCRDLR